MKKELSISLIRGISFLMIVLCHLLQYFHLELAFWFNVGVQIFFVLSGFLYGKKEIEKPWEWIKKQFIKILPMYYIYIILVIVFYYFFAPDLLQLKGVVANFLCIQGFTVSINGIEHLWFVSYILLFYLLTPILQSLYNKIKNDNKIVFCIKMVGIIIFLQFLNAFGLNILVPYFVSYMVGYLLAKMKRKTLNTLTAVVLPICVITNGIEIYVRYVLKLNSNVLSTVYLYDHALLSITLFLLMYTLFSRFNNSENKLTKWVLNFSDKYSYAFYIVHQIFILNTFSLFNYIENKKMALLLIIVAIIVSGFILNKISSFFVRLFSKPEKINSVYK